MNVTAEHRLRCDPAEMRHLADWVAQFADQAKLPPAARQAIDLSLEEWVTNVISYACADGREHFITIRFAAAEGEARVEVEDDGREFNPLTLPPVDVTEPLETRRVGGLGVHMMRQLMDALDYRRLGDHNLLTLVKRTA
jgi:serine/threonine-protein kinase RsbW